LYESLKNYLIDTDANGYSYRTIQAWNFDGIGKLRIALKSLQGTPGYDKVRTIGILADADDSVSSRFQQIQNDLRATNFSVPNSQLVKSHMDATQGNPSIIVLTVPRDTNGMIEDLCLQSVRSDPIMACVNNYCTCINNILGENGQAPSNIKKARLQAFLASRREPELTLGIAAQKGCFPFSDPIFDDIKSLFRLMVS
jgi:hypothetical protein